MKILATSDLHGYFPEITEKFDLLLICGDVCPAHDHYYKFQKEWFNTEFVDWINTLPFNDVDSRVVMVGGNHDYYLERADKKDAAEAKKLTNGRLILLKNQEYDFTCEDKTIKIFGTPYCKIFGNWAFMLSTDGLRKKYDEIPEGLDILISHDSPTLNKLGFIHEGWYSGVDAGNMLLDEYIEKRKPKYFFSGHIHSGNHDFTEVDGVMMANVSYINEDYHPEYKVLEFEI